MRIATSTIYEDQSNAIVAASSQQAQYSEELSTGKQLNQPSDNPTQISNDLMLHSEVTQDNTSAQTATITSNTLTATDGQLNTLTEVLQRAQTLAVQGASDANSQADRTDMANEVDQLFQETLGVANAQYGGQYLFAGTALTPNGAVQPSGSPASSVTVYGNNQAKSTAFPGGPSLQTSTTLQEAFNVNAANGSASVFDTLLNLRNALNGLSTSIQSSDGINQTGTVITTASTLGTAPLETGITADSTGKYSIQIVGPTGTAQLTFTNASTIANVIAAVNGAGVGVTASFNPTTEKLAFTANSAFQITDVPSAGATNAGTFVEAFHLQPTGTTALDISGQLTDLQNVLQVALSARSNIGSSIQTLSTIEQSNSGAATTNTASLSTIEDTNIPQTTSDFTLAQTALQAAYATTSRIEGHSLFDYL